jgi:hypothetical protein
VVQFA